MKNRICYKINELLKLIPDFTLQKVRTIEESEDMYKDRDLYYFVGKRPIEKVEVYYSLWVSKKVHFKDGEEVHLLASNINSKDLEALRIVKNDIISPSFTINDNYIESTEDLKTWLNNLGISDNSLEEIIETYTVYSIIEYPGVSTPSKYRDSWGYSSETLKLDEREIQTVLESIEDELLREKIRCILYARIFKRSY